MAGHPRVYPLNSNTSPADGPVVYWMQSAARTRCNHALEYAIHQANLHHRDLAILFVVNPAYPDANLRHFSFLLDGLVDATYGLADRGLNLTVAVGEPVEVVEAVCRHAGLLVTDRGYLRHLVAWRATLAERVSCPMIQVETNVVVPVNHVTDKEQYSAATLRPRIHRVWGDFLEQPRAVAYEGQSVPAQWWPSALTVIDPTAQTFRDELASRWGVDESVAPIEGVLGGERAAQTRLSHFIDSMLDGYAEARNDPAADIGTGLSAYLHFGHISPIEISLAALEHDGASAPEAAGADTSALLEELIVRRELAINFCAFREDYDRYEALPDWARRTLDLHRPDLREVVYDEKTLEAAATDDPYWNACQTQMVRSGRMHNYMRMYWGKKILEWSEDPETAFRIAVRLNDRYELDGRDPNGYAGVAWCFGKHDRPWVERPIFGTVRYMNANGLRRKFRQIDEYVRRWS